MAESDSETLPSIASLELVQAARKEGSHVALTVAVEAIRRLIFSFSSTLAEVDAWSTNELVKARLAQPLPVSRATAMLLLLSQHEAFLHRLTTDFPVDKAQLATYVSRNFVRDRLKCFVQASTTAIHFGLHIATNPAKSTLFHTNSMWFPLVVLPAKFHQVYTFCGSSWDEECGGWLFPVGDRDTEKALRDLFDRRVDPLTTAFLMPRAMKAGCGPYYRRQETAFLAQILLEVAQQVVIMTPANRVYCPQDDLPQNEPWHPACVSDWRGFAKKVSLVISGNRVGREDDLASAFRDDGLDFHWPPPPAFDGLTSDSDTEKPDDLLRRLFAAAAILLKSSRDEKLVEEVEKFLGDLFRVKVLHEAFKSAPDGRIIGDKGVAASLNLSRAAIYHQLQALEIDAGDMRSASTFSALIMKSPPLRKTANRLLSLTQFAEPAELKSS